LKNGTINADFAFQNNKRKEFADATNPDEKELFFDLNTFNYNVRYNVKKPIIGKLLSELEGCNNRIPIKE
jgi:hypothetical protein